MRSSVLLLQVNQTFLIRISKFIRLRFQIKNPKIASSSLTSLTLELFFIFAFIQ